MVSNKNEKQTESNVKWFKRFKVIEVITGLVVVCLICLLLIKVYVDGNKYDISKQEMEIHVLEDESATFDATLKVNTEIVSFVIDSEVTNVKDLKVYQGDKEIRETQMPEDYRMEEGTFICGKYSDSLTMVLLNTYNTEDVVNISFKLKDFVKSYGSFAYIDYSLVPKTNLSPIEDLDVKVYFPEGVTKEMEDTYLYTNSNAKYIVESSNVLEITGQEFLDFNKAVYLDFRTILNTDIFEKNVEEDITIQDFKSQSLSLLSKPEDSNSTVLKTGAIVVTILISRYLILFYVLNIEKMLFYIFLNSKKEKFKAKFRQSKEEKEKETNEEIKKQTKESEEEKENEENDNKENDYIRKSILTLSKIPLEDIYFVQTNMFVMNHKKNLVKYFLNVFISCVADGDVEIEENGKLNLLGDTTDDGVKNIFLKYMRTIKNMAIKENKPFDISFLIKVIRLNPGFVMQIYREMFETNVQQMQKDGIIEPEQLDIYYKVGVVDKKLLWFVVLGGLFLFNATYATSYLILYSFLFYGVNVCLSKILLKKFPLYTSYGVKIKESLVNILDYFEIDISGKNILNLKDSKVNELKLRKQTLEKLQAILFVCGVNSNYLDNTIFLNMLKGMCNSSFINMFGTNKDELKKLEKALKGVYKLYK